MYEGVERESHNELALVTYSRKLTNAALGLQDT